MEKYNIEHDRTLQRFEIETDGHTALIRYVKDGKKMSIISTKVPAEIGGRGIAAELTKAALEYARENSLKVNPVCSYVAKYMKQNSEWDDIKA